MTGRELARTVQERRRDVSVLVISGYAEVDGIAGDLPRLTKPFRKSELASSLTSLLADNLAPAALRARGESSQT
jgi:FixJ family two-component response regulator